MVSMNKGISIKKVKRKRKKIGTGSVSFILIVLGLLWAFSFANFSIGDEILKSIGLPAWSNGSTGIHYSVFYALLFFIPAFVISIRRPNHFLSKTSRNISVICLQSIYCF
ncbi:hypothetical protein P5G51_018615 [Virgibacillus sp. 179-BFC.A HS]|uniref:Uncharacterized protein n=1 Tax=Tigheibacillus jepli TaxID=3035914 RepID=A0ABU5CL41_9BACI|nr:hypothetical protein [Virgibacillus sp. 179-BFC.A HS]MDY0407076.1 hypothetical protein [Virgibacillus sp. 179-BFC.A HS]